jgi:hypothetical protein
MRYQVTLQSGVAREFRRAVAAGDLVTPNISGSRTLSRPSSKERLKDGLFRSVNPHPFGPSYGPLAMLTVAAGTVGLEALRPFLRLGAVGKVYPFAWRTKVITAVSVASIIVPVLLASVTET